MTLKDFIVERIETWPIIEAAMSRDRFKSKVESCISQIVENCVLIKFAQTRGTETQKLCIRHWMTELNSFIKNLRRSSVSVSKERACLSALENSGIDDPETTRNECEDKLESEGIGVEEVPPEIWSETLDFIWKRVPKLICLPKHSSTRAELERLLLDAA